MQHRQILNKRQTKKVILKDLNILHLELSLNQLILKTNNY